MSSLQATNPMAVPPAQNTHRVLVTGTNREGYTTFNLPSPVLNVEACRLVYAQVPAASETCTAISLRLGDREVEKVQTAIPSASGMRPKIATVADADCAARTVCVGYEDDPAHDAAMRPRNFFAGKAHFAIVPNGVELYAPHSPMDDAAVFTPPIPSVQTLRLELYALPAPTRTLLNLEGDTFAILIELASSRRP